MGHKDDQRAVITLLQRQVERAGIVLPGEGMAPGTHQCGIPVPKWVLEKKEKADSDITSGTVLN